MKFCDFLTILDKSGGFGDFGIGLEFDTCPLNYIGLSEIPDLGFSEMFRFDRALRIVHI